MENVENDTSVSSLIEKEYSNIIVAPYFKTPIDAKSYISGLDFFTGARMHACIAAFSSGIPVYPLAYSRKFNGLFIETLQYNHMGDCVNEKEEEILENLTKAFINRKLLKDQILHVNKTIVNPRLEELKKIIQDSVIVS
jgi:polysaccharide pyruvyl transferase WcaK-like protein